MKSAHVSLTVLLVVAGATAASSQTVPAVEQGANSKGANNPAPQKEPIGITWLPTKGVTSTSVLGGLHHEYGLEPSAA
jgi:hypothetical protein